jgi:NADH-quinone oxidoreductase subunit J
MSAGGQLVFAVCALVAIVAAVLTVTLRTPLRSAMALLMNILALAGLYLTLHAHLLAAIQLLVYAGAVVVLFVFVIMLIGPSAEARDPAPKGLLLRTAGAALMAMVAGGVAFGVAAVERPYVDLDQCAGRVAECNQFGGVQALGSAIYRDAAVPFEIVSVLLLVAIVAAVAVARGHTPDEKRAFEQRKTARANDASGQQRAAGLTGAPE